MSTATYPDCVFCKIVAGTIPAKRVYQDDAVIAFPDANPQAPLHFLVVPREHIASLSNVAPGHTGVLGQLLAAAAGIARQQGLGDGYRVVVNNGPDGGQTVDHLHLHVLGGRPMHWPPG